MEGKKMRMNVLLTSNSGQIDSQKGVLRSCCKSPLLWKKHWLSNWVFKKMTLMVWGWGQKEDADVCLSSGKKEGTQSHGVSNAWQIRGTGSSSARLEHHFHEEWEQLLERKIRTLMQIWHCQTLNRVHV